MGRVARVLLNGFCPSILQNVLSVQGSRAQISLDYANGLGISRLIQCVSPCVAYSVAGFPTGAGLVCSVESTRACIIQMAVSSVEIHRVSFNL